LIPSRVHRVFPPFPLCTVLHLSHSTFYIRDNQLFPFALFTSVVRMVPPCTHAHTS
jgi:hypothetical protein